MLEHPELGARVDDDLRHFVLRRFPFSGSDFPRRLNMTEEQKQALEAFLNTFTDDELLNDLKFSDPLQ